MWSDLERLVEASMQEWKIPGLALAVIHDGEVVLQQGYGVRDMRGTDPVTPDTQFLLCSITKSFTAAGLGLLVDEGKLEWNRPVREVIPEFRLQDALATERLTVRDLLEPRLAGRPVAEIAYGRGFNDAAHFSRAFRERFGCSPREWRQQRAQ